MKHDVSGTIPTDRPWRTALVLYGLLVVAWAVLFWPWLSGSVTIPYDAKAHFHAQVLFLARALASGQSPFWTPNVFAGSPQIADPQSLIFSPAILIALFDKAPSFWVVDLYVLLLLLAGGAAMVAFARERGWSPAAALVTGIAFAFAGSAYWRMQHIGQIESYAFLGVSMWLLQRALRTGTWLSGLWAGVAAALMIVQPDQVAFLGLFVLIAMVVDRALEIGGIRAVVDRLWRPLVAGAVGAAVIAALPLLMTVLFAAASNRPAIDIAEAATGSLHPASLLTFGLGDLFGASNPVVPYWGPSSGTWLIPNLYLSENMTQVYLGAIVALAVLVLGLGRGYAFARPLRVYTFLLVGFLAYALGRYTPIFDVMFHWIPGVAAFRRPADATFLIGAIAAVLAGGIIDRHIRSSDRAGWTLAAALLVLLLLVGSGVVLAFRLDRIDVALPELGRAAALIAVAALLIAALGRWGGRLPLTAAAVVAGVLTVDLTVSQRPNASTGLPPARYDAMRTDTSNETIAFLRDRLASRGPGADRQRVELLGVGFEWPNLGLIHGFDHTLGYNPLRLAEFAHATGAQDTIAGPNQRVFTALFPSYRCRLANMLGLRYVVSPVPIETVDHRLRPGDMPLVARTRDAYIYENPDALPRALVVDQWLQADFAEVIETGQWPTFDPRRAVLLEAAPEEQDAPALPSSLPNLRTDGPTTGGQRARIVTYENTRIVVETESRTEGFLVLHDVWHAWWRATVDGRDTPILKANVLFRAVRIPAGRATVTFTFEPIAGAVAELRERLAEAQNEGE